MAARHWAPPVLWMLVILLLSSDVGSGRHTGRVLEPVIRWAWPTASALQIEALHGLVRKAAHVAEYAVLALLWFRAFAAGRRWSPRSAGLAAVVLAAAWAGIDELHQSLYVSRGSSVTDVLLDSAAALAAAAIAATGWRTAAERLTGLLLWLAAAGGVVMLAVDLALGVPSGWLWLSTPAAALALALRHRLG